MLEWHDDDRMTNEISMSRMLSLSKQSAGSSFDLEILWILEHQQLQPWTKSIQGQIFIHLQIDKRCYALLSIHFIVQGWQWLVQQHRACISHRNSVQYPTSRCATRMRSYQHTHPQETLCPIALSKTSPKPTCMYIWTVPCDLTL